MATTLAFDVYGTLIDPDALIDELRPVLGDSAAAVARAWRMKQLELAFRRGLMGRYDDFATCTRDALKATLIAHGHEVDDGIQARWLGAHARLPAFAEVANGLDALGRAGYRRVAFSNGTSDAMRTVLGNAGLLDYFDALVSVDEIKRFKPDPAVYHHLARRCGVSHTALWLVSSNGWDVQGAAHAGLKTAWIKRDPRAVIEDEALRPQLEVTQLEELADRFDALTSNPG